MVANLFIAVFVLFSIGSFVYVYQYRGTQRYAGWGEYFAKGWPIFSPFNCLLYLFTSRSAAKPIIDCADIGDLKKIEQNWEMIREEAEQLMGQGDFEQAVSKDGAGYYDVGFRTFYKYGWRKFYLTWYGYTHESARQRCPKTVALLESIGCVNGAMFSILPPGSQLTRHLDPVACSLRYHLGLNTPNSQDCFIDIDGNRHVWQNGQSLLFDVTYLHYARNDSDANRLILMCDIERPMSWFGHLINTPYKWFMRMSIVPNMAGDKRGFMNRVFQTVVPALESVRQLKQSHPKLYKPLKFAFNTLLVLILLGFIWGIIHLLSSLFG